jgi:hypothetical protein
MFMIRVDVQMVDAGGEGRKSPYGIAGLHPNRKQPDRRLAQRRKNHPADRCRATVR